MTVVEYEKYILKRAATEMEASTFYAKTLDDFRKLFDREPTREEYLLWHKCQVVVRKFKKSLKAEEQFDTQQQDIENQRPEPK